MFQPILICWERRAELGKVYCRAELTHKMLAKQLKLSRYAEEEKHCVHLMLLGEIVWKPAKTSKMEMLISINEDMRTVPERALYLLRFLLAMTHRNPIRQELN